MKKLNIIGCQYRKRLFLRKPESIRAIDKKRMPNSYPLSLTIDTLTLKLKRKQQTKESCTCITWGNNFKNNPSNMKVKGWC